MRHSDTLATPPSSDAVMAPTSVDVHGNAGVSALLSGVKSEFQALVTIKTPTPPPDAARARLHVACVIDRSGSMAGAKLTYAKRAVRKLVKHLSPTDALHFVTYDTHAETVFTDGDLTDSGKEELVAKIKAVRSGNMTNLCAGLKHGADALEASAQRATKEGHTPDVKRIFLFSDGLVNKGITAPAKILALVDDYVRRGITVTSFGIGRDFDEKLMVDIAKHGNGDYAFLDTAESITRLVSKSIHGLLDLAGTEAKLEVRGLNGAVVTKVYGVSDDDDDVGDLCESATISADAGAAGGTKRVGEVAIGDLHLDNTKQILVQMEMSPTSASPVPQLPVMDFTMTYMACNEDGSDAHVASVARGSVSVDIVTDHAAPVEENADVASAYAIQRGAQVDSEVLALVRDGKRDEAITVKERNIDGMAELLKRLALNPANRDGCCARLARVIERHRDTLDSMKTTHDSGMLTKELRYEQWVCRAMSECGYEEGCDSDSWASDCEVDQDLSRFPSGGSMSSDDTDDDDDESVMSS